jgi:hypothetical protein
MVNNLTTNRYIVDSESFWREELHPRVKNLIITNLQARIQQRVTSNFWNFPVHEDIVINFAELLNTLVNDYIEMVKIRRLARIPNDVTLIEISNEFTDTIIVILWDLVRELIIKYYPLLFDNLSEKTGKVFSNDDTQNDHNIKNQVGSNDNNRAVEKSENNVNSGDKNLTNNQVINVGEINSKDVVNSSTIDRVTDFTLDNTNITDTENTSKNNTNSVTDLFVSPQNQGVTPNNSSTGNLGENGVTFTGSGNFTTNTNRDSTGVTDNFIENIESVTNEVTNQKIGEGTTGTNSEAVINNSKNENINVIAENNTNFESGVVNEIETNNNTSLLSDQFINASVKNSTGLETFDKLDLGVVLKNFYDMNLSRLLLELDNRMYHLYLQMHISKHVDYREFDTFQ